MFLRVNVVGIYCKYTIHGSYGIVSTSTIFVELCRCQLLLLTLSSCIHSFFIDISVQRCLYIHCLDVQYLVVASPVDGDVSSLTTGNLFGQILISTLNLNGLVFWYLGDSFTKQPYIWENSQPTFPQESMLNFLGLHIERKFGSYLEDHPSTHKWLVTMGSKSMKDPVVKHPFQMAIP